MSRNIFETILGMILMISSLKERKGCPYGQGNVPGKAVHKLCHNSNVWGWAYWNWNYVPHPVPNFNLVKIKNDGDVHTTQYIANLKKVIDKIY